MRRVLVFVPTYLPGHRAGGPVRSIAALIERLSDEWSFHVVTADRDLRSDQPYSTVGPAMWTECGRAHVAYLAPTRMNPTHLRHVVDSVSPDVYYLNSFFYAPLSIQPLLLMRVGLLPRRPTVVAPRGEFARAALNLKSVKKTAYLSFARRTRCYTGAIWHATSQHELADIRRAVASDADVRCASNLMLASPAGARQRTKTQGSARIACVARISPMKNVLGLLQMARALRGAVDLDLIGPLEDRSYSRQCEQAARALPPNVRARFLGENSHEEIQRALPAYDAFALPTRGENFGHAILEGMLAGCVPIISDRTPWRGLGDAGVGWDLPISDTRAWEIALQAVVDMDHADWERMSLRARHFAETAANSTDAIEASRGLFRYAASRLP